MASSSGRDFVVNILADSAGALTEMDGFASKVGKIAAGVGAAWSAANVGGQIMDSFSKGLDLQRAQSMLSAAFGGGDAARQAGEAAGTLFKTGLVTTMEEANDAVSAVSVIGSVDELGKTAFDDATKSATVLAQVMDEDVGGVTAAVASMMKSGLAPDAQTAFDVIAKGVTSGTNKAEDLLDTFTEYSVQFKQLGLTGGQALGLMNQGLAAGARNSDLVADALKEFVLRAQQAMQTDIDPKAVLAAQQAVLDATKQADDQMVAAHQKVRDANGAVRQSMRDVGSAEIELARAQREERDAQESLTQARKDAQQQLQDLADQVTDASLSERSAELAVQRAQEALTKTNADSSSSELDRQEAQLAYDQAVQNLDEQQRRTVELAQAKADADAKGIEGSDKVQAAQQQAADSAQTVVDAQQKVRDSTHGVRDAQRELREAQKAASDAAVAGAQAVQKAVDALQAASTPKLTTIGQAYADLGINGQQIAESLAKGGPQAAQAFQVVTDALRAVDDPAQRAQLAVQLFGTKAEDLQGALYALDPSKLTQAADDTTGAMNTMGDALTDNALTKEQAVQNSLDLMKANLIDMNGALGELTSKWVEFSPIIGGVVSAVGPLIGGIATMAATHTAAAAGASAEAGANTVLSLSFGELAIAAAPWILAVGVIAGLALLIHKNWDHIGPFFSDLWSKLGNGIDWIGGKFGGLVNGVVDFGNGIANAGIGVVDAWITMENGLISAWNLLDFGIHVSLPSWLGGFSFDVDDLIPDIPLIPKIPKLAQGGITNGPTLALIGDNPGGRELVAPLDEAERIFGPRTITILSPIYLDSREVGRSLREAELAGAF